MVVNNQYAQQNRSSPQLQKTEASQVELSAILYRTDIQAFLEVNNDGR
jgi:hypothetical protein